MGQKAISSISRLDTVKPEALNTQERMGKGVGMETPFYDLFRWET